VSSLLKSIRTANQRLGFQLETVSTLRLPQTAVIGPERIAALLSELLFAGAALRAWPLPLRGCDHELDRELDQYRRMVEQLRDLLPSIHQQLLAERARLEARRSHLVCMAEWARVSRQTL